MMLEHLSRVLQGSLSRLPVLDIEQPLATFTAVSRRAAQLEQWFDQAGPAPVPPSEKRRQALRRFLSGESLSLTDWRLLFASLADSTGKALPLLEQDSAFARVYDEVETRISSLRLSRRDWLALCYSYFAYSAEQPEANRNWLALREAINDGFAAVRQRSVREKAWMRVVERHRSLFADQAGTQLGEQVFTGEITDLSSLQIIAQIPDSSWLWQRIFAVLLARIAQIRDTDLLGQLPHLLAQGERFPRFRDAVLAACLTRYYHSEYRRTSLEQLKQHTLDAWGSPQLRSRKNAWLQHVEEPVCRMVMAWFARDDIELFFNLLKGEADVDQARLFYWLRFADQMTYTRIVMGGDAWAAHSSDFVEFRNNNKGRLGYLAGGPSHNNAVIMQLGDYLFVEFSGTGNACYVYKASKAPFKPEQERLQLNHELKQPGAAIERLPHTPRPSRPNMLDGWLLKFDEVLQQLGIVATDSPRHQQSQQLKIELDAILGADCYRCHDLRRKGGVFHIQLNRPANNHQIIALTRLGFKEVAASKGLEYWRN